MKTLGCLQGMRDEMRYGVGGADSLRCFVMQRRSLCVDVIDMLFFICEHRGDHKFAYVSRTILLRTEGSHLERTVE